MIICKLFSITKNKIISKRFYYQRHPGTDYKSVDDGKRPELIEPGLGDENPNIGLA